MICTYLAFFVIHLFGRNKASVTSGLCSVHIGPECLCKAVNFKKSSCHFSQKTPFAISLYTSSWNILFSHVILLMSESQFFNFLFRNDSVCIRTIMVSCVIARHTSNHISFLQHLCRICGWFW